jgi:maltose O-acetyltransferase
MPLPHESNPLISPPRDGEDPTQLALMIDAKPYFAEDAYLDRLRNSFAITLHEITSEPDGPKRMEMWRKSAVIGERCFITQSFFCEYVSDLEIVLCRV